MLENDSQVAPLLLYKLCYYLIKFDILMLNLALDISFISLCDSLIFLKYYDRFAKIFVCLLTLCETKILTQNELKKFIMSI